MPLTEYCCLCGNKIYLDKGFGWANMGPKERAEFSVHVECLGLGPSLEMFQDSLKKAIRNRH